MIVGKWTAAKVKALREIALRMTQEEFAPVIGYEVSTVQKWEQRATEARPVKGRSAEALDTTLARLNPAQFERFQAALSTAPLLSGGHPVLSGPETVEAVSNVPTGELDILAWEVDDDMRRREFGKLAAMGTSAALFGTGSHLGMSDVQRLRDGVAELEREDQRIGGSQLVDFALDQLATAKHRLDTSSFDAATGNAYASAVGELAAETGWLAYDAERHDTARRCYSDALALGTEADDRNLITHACLSWATQLIQLSRLGQGSPHHALRLIARARDLMRGKPPGRVHALIAVREAQAYGMLADKQGFMRAIATAWRELDYAASLEPLDECPQWLRFVNPREILGHEARGSADLGDFTRAMEMFTSVAEGDNSGRNDANLLAWSAATRARMGDLNGALDDALPVVTEFTDLSSARTLRVLDPIRVAVDQLAIGSDFRRGYDLAQKAITT